MHGIGDYVVSYDLSCDRERRRVDRLLKGYGLRVLESVFECRLSRRAKARLLAELRGLDLQTGLVILYQRQHRAPREVAGVSPGFIDDQLAYIF